MKSKDFDRVFIPVNKNRNFLRAPFCIQDHYHLVLQFLVDTLVLYQSSLSSAKMIDETRRQTMIPLKICSRQFAIASDQVAS